MSLWRAAVVLLLSTLLIVVLAGGAMVVGSSALFGGLLVAVWPEVEVSTCLDTVQETQEIVRDKRGRGVSGIGPLMKRATRSCTERTLSHWESIQWKGRAEDLSSDGTLSDADLAALDDYLGELESD
jgi:hypothetical protein